jgi:hypothetical protein
MEAAALALPTHPPCWIWWEYSQWPQECFRWLSHLAVRHHHPPE